MLQVIVLDVTVANDDGIFFPVTHSTHFCGEINEMWLVFILFSFLYFKDFWYYNISITFSDLNISVLIFALIVTI